MRVLVIGGGGREHAICWALTRELGPGHVWCAPGNPGIAAVAQCVPVDASSPDAVLELVVREQIDFTVIGPELPLTRGVVDRLTAAGHLACGPTRAAAEIESSKVFAKDLMARYGIPTARHAVAASGDEALALLRDGRFGFPVVLKADGLAAGKGVVIAPDLDTAVGAVGDMMEGHRFGAAGDRLVIEEYMSGREASFFVLTDGVRARVLPSAEDHKRAFDGDQGPNTGGMGAFSPSPLVDDACAARVLDEIVYPTLRAMAAEGRPYRGFLYCGLMLTAEGPKVVEFNARMGDPEAQVVLPALEEALLPHLLAASWGELVPGCFRSSLESFVGVVLASGGYPDAFETGKAISGLGDAAAQPRVLVFHAGTASCGGEVVTAGGRVLTVVGRGATFGDARARAYDAAARIAFDGVQFRRDIGAKALPTTPGVVGTKALPTTPGVVGTGCETSGREGLTQLRE
jgi:phosphoribosylamine---glycine ligase